MPQIEPWLSVEKIAQHIGVSKESIYRWLEKEKIPAHRVGKQWRFKPSEIDRWIKSGHAISNMQTELQEQTSDTQSKIKTKNKKSVTKLTNI